MLFVFIHLFILRYFNFIFIILFAYIFIEIIFHIIYSYLGFLLQLLEILLISPLTQPIPSFPLSLGKKQTKSLNTSE